MKKGLFKFLYIFFILFPIITCAEGIENFYIKATLEQDGDLRVREYFNLDGEYNGFQRIINYKNDEAYMFQANLNSYGGSDLHNGSNIYINEIRGVEVNSKFDFSKIKGDKFKKVSSAEKGDYGVYTVTKDSDGYTYTIYLPDDEEKAFYIDYTITELAILHNDVGELGWNIFTELNEDVENLEIEITFPNNQNEFRVWAHGPLNGVVTPKNNNTLIANVQNLRSYQDLDVRATFDKEIISLSNKKTNVDALQKILNYEENKAEQANYERQQEDFKAQTEAQNQIWNCYDSLDRSCYNYAAELVDRVEDQTKKADLKKQLEELNILVTQAEETIAKENIEYAEDYPSYFRYDEAKQAILILSNKELKEELLERLEVVEKKLTKEEEKSYKIFKAYIAGTIVAVIAVIIYIYYYHDREYKTGFTAPYLRAIPNHYSPSTVNYLFNREISNDAISAEILSLINKGIILCEKTTNKNGKEDYIITKNTEFKTNPTAKESALVRLILNGQTTIKLSEIKKKASSSYRSFLNRWDEVMKHCTTEALEEDIYVDDELAKYKKNKGGIAEIARTLLTIIAIFFIQTFFLIIPGIILLFISHNIKSKASEFNIDLKKNTSKKSATIVLIIIMLISITSIIYAAVTYHFIDVHYELILFNIVLITAALIYVARCKKRTETGVYEYTRWKAFKRFLLDFGKMDIKEVGEVKLWQEYLVYATVLGCADKVEKAMKLKVKDLGLLEKDIIFTDIDIHTDINHSLNRGIRDAYNKAVSSQIASSSSSSSGGSSWSSGGGGGGGFSSGGGSFGGGGGGGRF